MFTFPRSQFVGLRAGGWWDMGYEMDGAKGLLVGCVCVQGL